MIHNTPVSRNWRLVGWLWVAFLLNYADRQAVFSMLAPLGPELGLSRTSLGLVATVFLWAYAAALPVAGWLADRWPARHLVAGSVVLWSVAVAGTALSGSAGPFLFWRGAMGVTEALYFPAAAALIAGAHGAATRSRALGLHQSAQLFGAALGGAYGGWAAEHWGWRPGLGALAGAGVVYALLLGGALRGWAGRREEAATGAPSREPARLGLLVLLGAAFSFYCAGQWIIYSWMPFHLHERFGLSLTASGTAGTVFLQLGSFAGVLAGGWLGDRTGRRLPLAALGMALCPTFAWAAFAAPAAGAAAAATAGYGLTAGLLMANLFAAAFELGPPGRYGLIAGLLNAAGGVAGGIGTLLGGTLLPTLGLDGLALAAGVPTVLLAGVLLAVARRSRPPRLECNNC